MLPNYFAAATWPRYQRREVEQFVLNWARFKCYWIYFRHLWKAVTNLALPWAQNCIKLSLPDTLSWTLTIFHYFNRFGHLLLVNTCKGLQSITQVGQTISIVSLGTNIVDTLILDKTLLVSAPLMDGTFWAKTVEFDVKRYFLRNATFRVKSVDINSFYG